VDVLHNWYEVVQARAMQDFAINMPNSFMDGWMTMKPLRPAITTLERFCKAREEVDMGWIPMRAQVAFWPDVAGIDIGEYVGCLGELATAWVYAGEKTWDSSRKGKMSATQF
jgi:hypothetical protein